MQNSVTKKILLTLLLFITGSAWAEWVETVKTEKETFYMDPSTIRKDGDSRKVWEIVDYQQRNKDGSMSARLRMEYDCKGERHRFLSFSTHPEPMGGGDALLRNSFDATPDVWKDIPPSTPVVINLKIVCTK